MALPLSRSQQGVYQQAPNQQYIQNAIHSHTITGITSTIAGGSQYHVGVGGQGSQGSYATAYHLPAPTGLHVVVYFTDASGRSLGPITVDAAYGPIMSQISQMHSNQTVAYPTPTLQPKLEKMIDGDFSLDEIDQAEKIMDELREAV